MRVRRKTPAVTWTHRPPGAGLRRRRWFQPVAAWAPPVGWTAHPCTALTLWRAPTWVKCSCSVAAAAEVPATWRDCSMCSPQSASVKSHPATDALNLKLPRSVSPTLASWGTNTPRTSGECIGSTNQGSLPALCHWQAAGQRSHQCLTQLERPSPMAPLRSLAYCA